MNDYLVVKIWSNLRKKLKFITCYLFSHLEQNFKLKVFFQHLLSKQHLIHLLLWSISQLLSTFEIGFKGWILMKFHQGISHHYKNNYSLTWRSKSTFHTTSFALHKISCLGYLEIIFLQQYKIIYVSLKI